MRLGDGCGRACTGRALHTSLAVASAVSMAKTSATAAARFVRSTDFSVWFSRGGIESDSQKLLTVSRVCGIDFLEDLSTVDLTVVPVIIASTDLIL